MKSALFLLAATCALNACTRQTSPSMMNPNKPQLLSETSLEQIPVKKVNAGYMHRLADAYARYGTNVMQLSLAYDPNAKDYSAVQAFQDLSRIKGGLEKLGVRGITAETVRADGTQPTLMVSYDAVRAAAPEGCRSMPGMDNGLTTEKIGDYRFGCSIDDIVAKQIYRPSDLQGYAGHDDADGRRAASGVEYYRQVDREEAESELNRIERGDVQAE